MSLATATGGSARRYRVHGMDCGSCALTIENGLRQLPGVRHVAVSFATETMEVLGEVPDALIEQRLRDLGYRIAGRPSPAPAALAEGRGLAGFVRFLLAQRRLRIAAAVALIVLAAVAIALVAPGASGGDWLELVLALAVVVAGAPIFDKGVRALLFGRRVTIDLLMTLASAGALLIGEAGEAVTVVLLYTLGEALEAYSAERARDSLRSLLALQPQEATVRENHREARHADDHERCGHKHGGAAHLDIRTVPVAELLPGQIVLVRPGQRIPVDGTIVAGETTVDQAAVTGESAPLARKPGDPVLAGTVNGEGAIEIEAARIAVDSTLARIARLVEQAQARRSPAERFIDRFARGYTPLVVLLAVLVATVPPLFFDQPFLGGSDGWLYRGLALLIIACPCALVISIPVTVVSALTRLAQLGILVKSGEYLDRLADVRVVAFDKTGTLTHGRPKVTAVRSAECAHAATAAGDCAHCDDVVALAACVEAASEHPLAHAVVCAAADRRVAQRHGMAAAVTAHAGRGVSGRLHDGRTISVGGDALLAPQAAASGALASMARTAREAGTTVMYVARDDQLIGYIGVEDQVRESGRRAVQSLRRERPPIATAMLTGDSAIVATRVASSIEGLDEVRAELLPDAKLAAIESLRERFGTVAMVGDGINDAPALARADVGIAMGGTGTAQAMETADVVLMQDDLGHVPTAIRVSRAMRRLVKQNVALSLGLKLAFLALAVPGLATLWMAVVADVGATLLVTLNGMRLLKAR